MSFIRQAGVLSPGLPLQSKQKGITVSFSATKINSIDHHSTKNCQSAHNTWAADRSTVTAGDGIDAM